MLKSAAPAALKLSFLLPLSSPLLFLQTTPALADVTQLSFIVSGKEQAVLSLPELKKKVPVSSVTLYDSRYGKTKSYRCLPMEALMAAAFGEHWQSLPQTEAVIKAKDGYASVTSAARLGEAGGCLAFEDIEVPGWEPVGRKKADPGPFYLIWTDEHQTTANEYPWPYQVASIELLKFEERYDKVAAFGATASVERGFKIFKGQCLRCHAMNQQGGRIGPDLNAPRGITDYRDKKTLLEFIRAPSAFRHSEMPDHAHLSDSDLEDLYEYLAHMSRTRKNP